MPLIVETGNTANANSYVSLDEAAAYHASMQNDWAGDQAELEAALIIATKSIDTLYGAKFMSVIKSQEQSLLFPRVTFRDRTGRVITGIPAALKNAVCEVALMNLNGEDVFPGVETSDNLKSQTVGLGDLTKTVEYRKPTGARKGFARVETELASLLRGDTSWRMKL